MKKVALNKLVRLVHRAIKPNYKVILQIGLGLVSILLAVYFIKHEQLKLTDVKSALLAAEPLWLLYGFILLALFVVVQGMMYQQSFRAIQQRITLRTGMSLFLKRNLVSVFLPAGLLTNMMFFNESVEKKEGVNRTQIYFASAIFSFCSIASGVLVSLPALIWFIMRGSTSTTLIFSVLLSVGLLTLAVYAFVSISNRGVVYQFVERRFPAFSQFLDSLQSPSLNRNKIWQVLGLSILIEIIGIFHLFISIKALGGTPTFEIAIIGYSIVLLLLMSSPFLRGIGAIEVALTYSLTLFGISNILAVSIAVLFRFFEFWAVLLLGLIALVSQRDNILLRLIPSFLLFILGIVNIASGITPALPQRLRVLENVIPLDAIHASTWLVILSGFIMLAIAVYLINGLRNAWIAAIILSSISLLAHFTKGIDWEEGMLAAVTLGSLIYQRKQYFIKPDLKLARRSVLPGIIAVLGVILFGTFGFYWLDTGHFNMDFTLLESFKASVATFLLLDIDQDPVTSFGKEFIYGIKIFGGISLTFLIFLFLRPLISKPGAFAEEELQKAKELVKKHGRGSLDYFKTYYDKLFWFSEDYESFVSFKTSRKYAIVLENPVSADGVNLKRVIQDFDAYCFRNGLRSAYYRVPGAYLHVYESLGKKTLPIGEEAVVDIESWTIEGSEKKTIRNAINKLTKEGYIFKANKPPQKDSFLQQLRAVSDSWLKDMERDEIVFSQGCFLEREQKDQVILSAESSEGKVIGFANLIPDYVNGEANFDLMRKTDDAPNGTMDFLFVKMFEYLKNNGYKKCNMGMVPMSGIANPENIQEWIIKLTYEKIGQFRHYKSLRAYKEKFEPEWQMMYLVYNAPFDLIYLPRAMERIIKV